jgi:hypothetical protein
MSQGVALTPDGSRVFGFYNSYGQLGEYNLADQIGKFALYHKACWELIGKPEYTVPSAGARDQGFCLPIHGKPMPKPTPAWLESCPTWHALERVIDAYWQLRADLDMHEAETKAALFTKEGQARLFAEYRAEKARRYAAERAQQEAWYSNPDHEAPEPAKLVWPDTYVYECITFDWGWLGVLVSRDDYDQIEKERAARCS